MRRKLLAGLFIVGVLALGAAPSRADDYSRGNSDHVLRYIAYAAHPFGIAAEYGVARPIHWLVSRPVLCVIFGHEPNRDANGRDKDKYFEWK